MTFERTTDYALVRKIVTHPKIYRWLCDDGSPSREDYQVIEHPAVWYVLVRDEKELLGMFMVAPQNAVCWEVHTCLLPNAWGPMARQAAKDFLSWLWENSPCQRLVTTVPTFNKLAKNFAESAGMTYYGYNRNSFLRNGKLHDQYLLGVCRKDQ